MGETARRRSPCFEVCDGLASRLQRVVLRQKFQIGIQADGIQLVEVGLPIAVVVDVAQAEDELGVGSYKKI